jgi:hypothetical protein
VVIPTRSGNGAIDWLLKNNYFSTPTISSLEEVLEYGIEIYPEKRTFADLWDLEKFSGCDQCFQKRKDRLEQMNLYQKSLPQISCDFEIN